METHKSTNDVWELLGRVDAKLDRVITDTAANDSRISSLEKGKSFERGVSAVLGAIAGFFGPTILKHLGIS